METTSLGPSLLWLLVLLFPALLVTALCLCCRDFPGPNSEVPSTDGPQQPSGLVILKPRYCNWPPAVPCQPDLLPIPRSPQPPEPSRRIPSSRRDVDTRSEPSYENEEPEDADEEDDYHNNEGYLIVLPDGSPNSSSEPLPNSAPNLVSPGLRESPSSTLCGEDYVNVSASESTEVSLGGSCEYVNVPEAQEKRTPSSRTPVTDQDGEEEGPDYENVQEQNGHSFSERLPKPPFSPSQLGP
ncbi:linker for activation of T-cells family member 1 isoform X2 [Antechinus flavipes]|uniref:linker for activation of T-cells family member 1 isoform X2 n=1 Tax=Antechinus flavipes TaxID=38775 RepID=UPI002236536A|nr:linker for activation of T-cells family member 1 isoform X2 [Antechinus flavipes]